MLTVVDVFSREAPAIEVGQHLRGSMSSMHSAAWFAGAARPVMAVNLPGDW